MGKGIEVEMKAWVKDLGQVEQKLGDRARRLDEISYADSYFTFPGIQGFSFHRFRLRETGKKAIVTVKEKVPGQERGVSEFEFEVSDPAAFLEFARIFGFQFMLKKEKKGRRYLLEGGDADFQRGPVVELVRIEGLGDFVEIEIMVDAPEKIAKAEARILEIYQELAIPESAMEGRAYTLLLYAQEELKEKL